MKKLVVRKRFIVAAVFALIVAALIYLDGKRTPRSFPDVSGGTLIVPVRVHLLRSRELPAANCELTPSDATGIIARVNEIWKPARIRLELESVREEKARNPSQITLGRGRISMESVRNLRPHASLQRSMFHVYYVHLLCANGTYLGVDAIFVRDTPALRPVPGGIDTPVPRVTAHEFGHAFGLVLPHHRVVTNLMAGGTAGIALTPTQIQIARQTVSRLPFARQAKDKP